MNGWKREVAWGVVSFLVFIGFGSLVIAACGWERPADASSFLSPYDPISLPSPVGDDLTPTDGSWPVTRHLPPMTPTVADIGWSCSDQTAWVTLEGSTRQLQRLSPGVFQLGSVNDSQGNAATLSLHGAVTNGLGDLVVTCIAEPLVLERVAPTTTAKIGICG